MIWIFIGAGITILGGVITALAQLTQNAASSERMQRIQTTGEEIREKLIDKTDDSFPGFQLSAVLNIEDIKSKKIRYIWDIGQDTARNRISMYMDTEDNLIYRVLDKEGTAHVIKVPQKIHTFKNGNFYHFAVAYGSSEIFSFMQLFINNREVARLQVEYRINFPENIDFTSLVIGADIKKTNTAGFVLSMLGCGPVTLTKKEREVVYDAVITYLTDLKKI